MAGFADLVSYLDSGGLLALCVLIGWGFYTERLRLGRDFDDLEEALAACREEIAVGRAEVKVLWEEKIEDKEKAADLARAYLKIREVEKS